MPIVTIGIDLAKKVFAVHGVDETDKARFIRPRVPRDQLATLIAQLPACLIAIEACSGASLGAPVSTARPHGLSHGAQSGRVLSHVAQARRGGCCCDPRSGGTPEHAFRAAEGRTAAGDALPTSDTAGRR